jgi:hypothetical protein
MDSAKPSKDESKPSYVEAKEALEIIEVATQLKPNIYLNNGKE